KPQMLQHLIQHHAEIELFLNSNNNRSFIKNQQKSSKETKLRAGGERDMDEEREGSGRGRERDRAYLQTAAWRRSPSETER
ncbi:hypothetical protein A2U01_0074654, partial [Trifolium medium]|nr:hypothetical protein [Trifolium medium]